MYSFLLNDDNLYSLQDLLELLQAEEQLTSAKVNEVECLKIFVEKHERVGKNRWYSLISKQTFCNVWFLLLKVNQENAVPYNQVLGALAHQANKQDSYFLQSMAERRPGRRRVRRQG